MRSSAGSCESLVETGLRGGEPNKYQEKEESGKVKFICFFEYKAEDAAKVIERWHKRMAMGEVPDFPRTIYGPFSFSSKVFPRETMQGFAVYETDNEETLYALASYYIPIMQMDFRQILENRRTSEIFDKWSK